MYTLCVYHVVCAYVGVCVGVGLCLQPMKIVEPQPHGHTSRGLIGDR